MNQHITKEDTQTANKHLKGCPTSFVSMELKIKTLMRYHYTLIKMAKIKKKFFLVDNTNCWWVFRATGTVTRFWVECKTVQPLWKIVWTFLTKLNILLPSDRSRLGLDTSYRLSLGLLHIPFILLDSVDSQHTFLCMVMASSKKASPTCQHISKPNINGRGKYVLPVAGGGS